MDLLLRYEQQSALVNKRVLYQTLAQAREGEKINFIIFSCLASKKDKEELVMDFFKTAFFYGGTKKVSRKFKRTTAIIQELRDLGAPSEVTLILPNTEPARTWGWQTPLDELTLACEIMAEEAEVSGLFTGSWRVKLWSEIETSYGGEWSFQRALDWARGSGPHQFKVREQINCLAKFSERYHFPLGLKETALRQVAAYAFEGVVLGAQLPSAILLQSENPYSEKDPLYNCLRDKNSPLPIIHPFLI